MRPRPEIPPEIEDFLNAGRAPLVFTLGSSAVLHAGHFYTESAKAARLLNKRAVLLVGKDTANRPTSLPPEIGVFDYAPYSQLFPRAAAIVHQGGVGTTGQAMRAGRPMLVMPFGFDQQDNAHRVEKRGIARTISRKKYSAETAAAALRKLRRDALPDLRFESPIATPPLPLLPRAGYPVRTGRSEEFEAPQSPSLFRVRRAKRVVRQREKCDHGRVGSERPRPKAN